MKRLLVSLSIIIMFILIGSTVLATTGTTNTSDLNFREKASTSSNIIQKISKGSKVEILDTEGDWYKISYDGKTGYVSKQYVDEEKVSNNETSSTNVETIDYSKLNTTKTTDKVTLYVLPLLNSTSIDVLSKNDEVKLISVNGDWAYVKTKNNYGWVFASKLLSTTITISGTVTENTNMQEEKTQEQVTENKEENKEENKTEEKTEQKVETTKEEKENKVTEQTTTTTTNTVASENEKINYPITMYVNVEAVNVRSEASATSKIVTSVGKDTPVTVKGKEGDWYKIEVSDGKGYIKADYLSKNK